MKQQSPNKKKGFRTWFGWGLLGVLALAAGSLYTPYPLQLARFCLSSPEPHKPVAQPPAPPAVADADKKQPQSETVVAPVVETAAPWRPDNTFTMPDIVLPPFPPALPEKVESGTFEHVNELGAGINMRSGVTFKPGSTASVDRKVKDAYVVQMSLSLYQPEAATGEELKQVNPKLPMVLNQYDALMQQAQVSPWFHSLYLHKQNRIRKNAATLDRLLDRHNFYDTDTILQISAPDTGRKVLWMQADMDVVSDGSDGDRLPKMSDKVMKSDYYQPSTSYRWRKVGKTPNPLLAKWEDRLEKLKKDSKSSKDAIEHARTVVADLKLFSFLLAEYDPFIVIPLTFKEGKDDTYRPQPGDYAAVVVDNRVFPALVGDYGPKFKTGEASLRLSKLVNPRATSYARAVSHLGVSYIIFPGSKEEKNGPPDYDRLNSRVQELLNEIGGLGPEAKFQVVEDQLKPKH